MDVAARLQLIAGSDERHVEVRFTCLAHPFMGEFTDLILEADLAFFSDNLSRLTVPGEVVLGGERAAELRLKVGEQSGGSPGALAVEVTITPSADADVPSLRYVVFDQLPFADAARAAIRELLA